MDSPTEQRIEVVRGRIDAGLAERLVGFWTRHKALSEPEARERLAEVVCLLRDPGGEIVGVNSVYQGEAPLVGRQFWIYRGFLAPGANQEAEAAMIKAAYQELAQAFAGSAEEPEGLCVLIGDPPIMERYPEAVWPETGLLFAGYTEAGVQVRIGYFDRRRDPVLETDERYRMLLFSEAEETDEAAVLELWEREGAVSPAVARRRIRELAFVGLEARGGLAGLSTVYLERSAQLRMEMWHYRTYVALEHRRSYLAEELLARTTAHLEERFVSGLDTRAAGVIFELESEGLKRAYTQGMWPRVPFTFIGENAQGDHVRVLYFPGARVRSPVERIRRQASEATFGAAPRFEVPSRNERERKGPPRGLTD